MILKVLTQNLHCFAEEHIDQNQVLLAQTIIEKDVDVVFLQEVAQSPSNQNEISVDNYAYRLLDCLSKLGQDYHCYFEPIKQSFSIYEEGVAILSKLPLVNVNTQYISKTRQYADWRSRKLLYGRLLKAGIKVTVATTHFGWTDHDEVFEKQFDKAISLLPNDGLTVLAGDFNITQVSQSYQHMCQRQWHDLFKEHPIFFNHPTFRGDDSNAYKQSRLDYIMTNRQVKLIDASLCFIDQRISDHYGVYAVFEYNK